MVIHFAPVTRDNWLDVGQLELRPGQQVFVTPNFVSLAESRFYPEMNPLAIYDSDQLIGFCMHCCDPGDSTWWIVRLMIDDHHQGRGYGKAAMRAVRDMLSAIPGCARIKVPYDPENIVAENMLKSLDFVITGELQEGETVAVYVVGK